METRKEVSRSCKECNGLLVGRIDAVYCCDACRTSANNRAMRERAQSMPECIVRIQKTLLHNHRVLSTLRNRGGQLFSKLYLLDLGFNFHYVTSFTTNEEATLFYIFNLGYTLNNDQVILLPEIEV